MVKSRLIIAGSNFIFNHINENYMSEIKKDQKLLVIFRGINLDYFNPKNISLKKKEKYLKDWNVDKNKFTILLPGRLTSWKGQEKFIESLNILIEDYKEINFEAIILGSDQGRKVYLKKLKSLVDRYRLGNKIKFIPFCTDMPIAYDIADIVISSSTKPEAFGRVAVEAQAMQKPIVASNIGGSNETIINKKTGFLYKHDDPRHLAQILYDLISKDKEMLYSIGIEGRKNVIKKFDVEKMCQSTFTEYKKLLKL